LRAVGGDDHGLEHTSATDRWVIKVARCSRWVFGFRPRLSTMTLAVETVLTPVDGSDTSMRAIEYAVAIAERYDAGVHALYVVDEENTRTASFGDVDDSELAAANEAFIADAHELAPEGVPLSHSSAYGFSAMTKTRHPGSVVLDAA